jgi:hypothetical protein
MTSSSPASEPAIDRAQPSVRTCSGTLSLLFVAEDDDGRTHSDVLGGLPASKTPSFTEREPSSPRDHGCWPQ